MTSRPCPTHRLPYALLGTLGLALTAACQGSPTPGAHPQEGAIAVRPAFQEGRAYQLQAVVNPLSTPDVAGVVVTLHTVVSGVESAPIATSPTLAPAAFASPLIFAHLNLNTTYRVRGTAYDASPAPGVISVPSPSYVDVAVTNDDAPAVGNLQIRLKDVVFDATATTPGGIQFSPGVVVDASASPTISQ